MEPRQSMDPFEVAFKDAEELPPDSPTADSMDIEGQIQTPANVLTSPVVIVPAGTNASTGNNEDEDEDDNMDINIRNISYKRDPDKAARTQAILSRFTEEQMERVVMTDWKDSGPIRPCHIREAYRRLKLEGKVPRRSVPRLF